ncbi:hypothetical protein HYPGJ_30750 [Hyphomicrobium sp. GJ21]|nr:hypothetical protein HYPGJ_30750 [Hyphomicrobium sp. GJ21]
MGNPGLRVAHSFIDNHSLNP